MASRAYLQTNTRWLDDAVGMMINIDQVVSTAGKRAYEKSKPYFMKELHFQPGPTGTPGRKIEWTSRKQQQAYFASDGFGGGIPTKRTGKLSASWFVDEVVIGGVWQVVVNNESIASRFVYGSLALSNLAAAARFQQRFHKITGWPFLAPKVVAWFDLILNGFRDNIDVMIGDLGTTSFRRWGVTPRLKKRNYKNAK